LVLPILENQTDGVAAADVKISTYTKLGWTKIQAMDLTWQERVLAFSKGDQSMSEQQIKKPKSFLGVQPAWCLGVVLIIAILGIFQLI
jgi:hypothetical protein